MLLGDAVSNFVPYFKVHSLVSAHPKSIILRQTNNVNMVFHVVVSVYRLVRFEPRPSSLLNFGTANESVKMCYVLTLSSRKSLESRRSKLWFTMYY